MDKTVLFDVAEFKKEVISKTLKEVYNSLELRGYNPINQIVGYIISGDPGYISSYKDARKKIQTIERTKIIEVLLDNFQGKKK